MWRIDSGVEATKRFTDAKNIELFAKHRVFTAEECAARQEARRPAQQPPGRRGKH